MSGKVYFSFPLSSRMRAFIELRDALACLESARQKNDGPSWLHAACDLHASLTGDHGRKPAISEVVGLFQDVEAYLKGLSEGAPLYKARIEKTCNSIRYHVEQIKPSAPSVIRTLEHDALLGAYLNSQKKHDWLGHKFCLQQSIGAIWKHADTRTSPLQQALLPICNAVSALNSMLNDFVEWKEDIATGGTGHITPSKSSPCGLLVIALPEEDVANGIIPDMSGNRLAIRVRFQQWRPGEKSVDYEEDQPYSMMLVPIGG